MMCSVTSFERSVLVGTVGSCAQTCMVVVVQWPRRAMSITNFNIFSHF